MTSLRCVETTRMAQFEFQILNIHRQHLRDNDSAELRRLNDQGAHGWHIVAVRDDPRDGSCLVFFMERQITTA